jgi:hypothetical protein
MHRIPQEIKKRRCLPFRRILWVTVELLDILEFHFSSFTKPDTDRQAGSLFQEFSIGRLETAIYTYMSCCHFTLRFPAGDFLGRLWLAGGFISV